MNEASRSVSVPKYPYRLYYRIDDDALDEYFASLKYYLPIPLELLVASYGIINTC
jgi:hypothetical protein